jgi:hypothetical protein
MTEALVVAGADVSVDVLRGAPMAAQAGRLEQLGVRQGRTAAADIVLVDLPDPNEGADAAPPARLATFDDRDWFEGHAGLVIQPSLPAWGGPGQAERVLAGYAFFPIQARLRELAAAAPLVATGLPEVVVCFGGSDPADVTSRLAPAIAGGTGWSTVVIVGPDYRGPLNDAQLSIVRDPPNLYERLAGATVAVAGAGSMKFELALLGRPGLLVAVVDDQLAVGPPFAATDAARYLGDGRTIDPAAVGAAVAELLADEAALRAMARRGPTVVDGRGAERVAAAILELAG